MNYRDSNKCSHPAKSAGILYANRGDDAMVIFYCAIQTAARGDVRNMHISLTCQIGIE